MSARPMVDRNGMRAGAGISAVALLLGLVFNALAVVWVVAVTLTMGALFGPSTTPLSWIYRGLKSGLKLRIPKEPEDAAPPRFAQTLGSIFLWVSVIGFASFHSHAFGWVFAMIVAALQTLLAVTGICVGCEMYLIGKRLAARGA